MKLILNREFLIRHLFSLAVLLALGGWFGYDALVRYPKTPAPALYAGIEKAEPGPDTDVEGFKAGKIRLQFSFMLATLLAAAGVGLHLFLVSRFSFSFDEEGFEADGVRRSLDAVTSVDESLWATKGILVLNGEDFKIKLDSWHFVGVKDFYEKFHNRG